MKRAEVPTIGQYVESVAQLIEHRKTRTEQVYAFLESKLNQWIGVHELATVGGFAAWRTRVSEARTLAERDGFALEWNHNPRDSQYRLIRKPLGRDAAELVDRRWNETGPYQEPFCLKP